MPSSAKRRLQRNKRNRRLRKFGSSSSSHLPRAEYTTTSSSSSGDDGSQPVLSSSQRGAEDKNSSRPNSGDDDGGGPLLRRYQSSLLSELLDQLNLPPSADGVEPDSVDNPDLPYAEILQALTRSSFLDKEKKLRDAVAEYQVHKYLLEKTFLYRDHKDGSLFRRERVHQRHSAGAVFSVNDDITTEEFLKDLDELSPTSPVDEFDKLDQDEIVELELKRALYRIKALLLLKGKAVDKLDDAALERKYPKELVVENTYFLGYEDHEAFGWYFDSDLSEIASLTDYQRLVILNYWEDQYQDWNCYRSLCNTPETDREYLLYWKAITEEIKWIEDYMYVETSSREWSNIWRKASYQAIRIATRFSNISKDLALLGIQEFVWSTRLYTYYLKDLDGVFYEIWRRVIKKEEDCFTNALKEVYGSKMFPSRERCMKDEKIMEGQFHLCTAGITKKVPESVVRGLIDHQVRRKMAMTRGYEHYARKKLKVAEYIGLIGKASTPWLDAFGCF